MASPLFTPTPGAPQRPTGGAADANEAHDVAHAQEPASKSASEAPHPFVRFVTAPLSLAVVSGGSACAAFWILGKHTVTAGERLGNTHGDKVVTASERLGNTFGDKVVTASERLGTTLGESAGNRIFAGLVVGSCVLAAAGKYAKP